MHAAVQFTLFTVTASAESVDGSTPAARVTWNITIPPECVASVRVDFRTSSSLGPIVATYTTTNTSQTVVIQSGLQCTTNYYITVVVTGNTNNIPHISSSPVQVFVGGNCVHSEYYVIRLHLGRQNGRDFCTSASNFLFQHVPTNTIPFMYGYVECPY